MYLAARGVLMGMLIDGKAVAATVRAEVAAAVTQVRAEHGISPGLATVLVGDDPASAVYVRTKERMCAQVGMVSLSHRLSADVSQAELVKLLGELNRRADVHGILVQLPLPPGLDQQLVIETIDPGKDVDGLHPFNQGALLAGKGALRPCTPSGVLRLIDSTGVALEGKRAAVLGRSVLVGKPVGLMLLERNATVTYCHSRTADLREEVSSADVLIAAIGRPLAIGGDWIKPGAVVIDVGISRLPSGEIRGDVDFEAARPRAGFITPVPGGVGPMTVAMLLANTVKAAKILLEQS